MLAGVLGDVPPDVDAAVPIDPHKTLRERMEPLRAAQCSAVRRRRSGWFTSHPLLHSAGMAQFMPSAATQWMIPTPPASTRRYAERAGHGAATWTLVVAFALGRGCMGPIVMGGVSLILNNSAPRKHLGAVNGFAGTFTNVARAAAPVFAGALTAGMVHAARTFAGDGNGDEEPSGDDGSDGKARAAARSTRSLVFGKLSIAFLLERCQLASESYLSARS